jgi:hypothetical protein
VDGARDLALRGSDAAHVATEAVTRGTAHLCISAPMGKVIGICEGSVPDLLASHPPVVNRIEILRHMGLQN